MGSGSASDVQRCM